ncbi:hypothetical protein SAMD00023353_0102970 [Rosellinia necatrix]|uniref:Uncharacterized protein n=1 Tax=Rosellinia necatrix TaxID=77044 RepID=A0A1S7UHX7_ROSNE|nr:hypothetical protein SAMD00023353_0102970 [Rosellinia necatrix]
MGLLHYRRDDGTNHPPAVSNAPPDNGDGGDTVSLALDPWLLVVIIIGVLIVLTLAVFVLVHCVKTRRNRDNGFRMVPARSPGSPFSPKREPGWAGRQLGGDLERELLIRKSLAGRSSLALGSHAPPASSAAPDEGHHPSEAPADGQGERTAQKDDWKALEAHVQNEKRAHALYHQHPAFASHPSLPQPAQKPSPARPNDLPLRHHVIRS